MSKSPKFVSKMTRGAALAIMVSMPLLAMPAFAKQSEPEAVNPMMERHGGAGQEPMMPQGGGAGPIMSKGSGCGPGMMMGPDAMMGAGGVHQARGHDFTAEEVREVLEGRIAWHGATRLQVGEVSAGDVSITAEIETVDGSLVHQLEIDPETGAIISFD